jgi:hypothetical protein
MEWFTKNFAVISAVLLFGAAAASICFLFAYLSVFDWRLIWLIEYSDLAKLFLVFGAFASIFAAIIASAGQNYFSDKQVSPRIRLVGFGVLGAFFLVILGFDLYQDFHSQNDLISYHIGNAFCWCVFIVLLALIFERHALLLNGDWSTIWPLITLVVILVPSTGSTYGQYVKRIAETHVTIWSRREEFQNVRVVMWFSHHVAFYTGKKVIVLQTADVVQVELEQTDQR